LFNLRGSDIICNPVFFSYAIVTLNSAHLFIGRIASHIKTAHETYTDILDDASRSMLEEAQVTLHSYGAFSTQIASILVKPPVISMSASGGKYDEEDKEVTKRCKTNMRVVVEGSSSMYIAEAVLATGAELVSIPTSPIQLFKACKNEIEIEGLRKACLRDSAAVVSFLAWLEDRLNSESDEVLGEEMREHALGLKMSTFRESMGHYMGDSFETISAVSVCIQIHVYV
jgi:Xaa-Pro aminopeptidase